MDKNSLVRELVRDGYLKTPRLIEAFTNIDRKDFVLPECASEAYENHPLSIGFGQTISQPLTVAFMLELLEPQPGEQILDIGSGSGWQTALVAYCVSHAQTDADGMQRNAENSESTSKERRPMGYVVAIEIIPELAEMTKRNVSKYNFIEKGIVKVFHEDATGLKFLEKITKDLFPRKSAADQRSSASIGGFDKIIAAAAGEEIPEAWKKQLKVGGRIVAPVGNSIVVMNKIAEDKFKAKEHFGFSFVPLVRGKKE